ELGSGMIANVAGGVVTAAHVCNKNLLAAGCHVGHLAFANVRSLSNHYLCHMQEKFHQAYLISPVRKHPLGELGKLFQRARALLSLYLGAFNRAIKVAYRLVVDLPFDGVRDSILAAVGKAVLYWIVPRCPSAIYQLCNERQRPYGCTADTLNYKQLFIVFWL